MKIEVKLIVVTVKKRRFRVRVRLFTERSRTWDVAIFSSDDCQQIDSGSSLQSLLTKSSDFITPERRRKNFAKKKMSKFIIIFVVYLSFTSTDALQCDKVSRAANLRVKRSAETCQPGQESCKFKDNSGWKADGCGPAYAEYV